MILLQPFHRLMRDGRLLAVSFVVLALLVGFGLQTTAAQDTPLPDAPPDAAAGLETFAARCANCHGPQGNGDGELAVNLAQPPRAFTNPAFRQTAVPASFHDFILTGNLDAGMPGFGSTNSNPLSDAQVWDAIAAVMSLATPATAVERGQQVYTDNCAACHGETGLGDGPDAAASDTPVPDLTDLAYWFNRSNDVVLANLEPGKLAGHDYDLGDGDLADVVDYARTFSYNYVPPADLTAPIAAATIQGQVTNATSGEIVTGMDAHLRAFSPNIEEMLTLTTTVGTDGRFSFDVSDVSPDWVYLVNVQYDGLAYSSDVGQLSNEVPNIDLPVFVYDQTTDPTVVDVLQVHLVMNFASENILQVTELYVFENLGTAVFVGEAGNPDLGVVRVDVPANAENVSFERAFSAMENFIPAPEVVASPDGGYVDTIPLRPGRSNSSLVVNYTLAYDEGVSFAHDVPYAVTSATVIVPDVGVELVNADAWTLDEQQTMGGMFLSYAQQNLPAGSTFDLTLEGVPQEVSSTTGSSTVATPRNQTTELIIGGVALLLIGGGAAFFIRSRTSPDDDDDYEAEEYDEEEEGVDGNGRTADELIQMIAALDEAHEKGELDDEAYHAEREQLKAELKAIW
ncbi:MAG: c-type cytochrome [Anaerolineales bacterium]|nr:c-type cytochrome [Anaerolineales bacterium]MCB9004842.1 c-type cytochrome [Ardenticatenaceae bacterium]